MQRSKLRKLKRQERKCHTASSSYLILDVKATLRFFDEAPSESDHHASGVVGVLGEELGAALLVRYLKNVYGEAMIVSKAVNTGKQRGPRLDQWVAVESRGRTTLFQVEIKNWSAHSIGGKKLLINASRKVLRAHRKERWNHYWDGRRFRSKKAQKVLRPMVPPEDVRVEPLICFWDAVHPKGADAPLFRVPLKRRRFKRLWVFSMSSYLRGLRSKQIRLHMPEAVDRLNWLRQLVSKRR